MLMEKIYSDITIEQFQECINILNTTMNDYLYLFDLRNDYYFISNNAMERFNLPANSFHDVVANMAMVTVPEDMALLVSDIDRIVNHGQQGHNLQYRWIGRDGRPVWINCRGRVINGTDGAPAYLFGCVNEIGTKQKADNVSGLLMEESLHNELNLQCGEDANGFLIRIGIDNFKEINENKGLEYGDMIIRKTAECIQAALLPGQKVYRVVADEYMIVDFADRSLEDAVRLYQKIQNQVNSFIVEQCYEVFYTISAGIIELSRVVNKAYHNLMKLSEFSLNEAKNMGKNKYYIYKREDYNEFLSKKELTSMLLWAVNHDFEGFETYFQPIMDIREGKLCNAETLLRFRSEKTGMISPGQFIPLLEESNLIIPVGKWVLEQAMKACAKIRETLPDFKVSVNLSYIQVLKSNVLSEILEGLEKFHLSADSIIVELTESGLLESNSFFYNFCEGLKENGIPLALDDFGTGYSNFRYLYDLQLNTIKIDRSLTLKALNGIHEHNMLAHMSEMVHDIDLKLCIEGIETKEELDKISEIDPDYIQGYYFGKPCPFKQFMEQFVEKA